MNENELRKTATDLGIEVDETMGEGKLIDEISENVNTITYSQHLL